MTTLFVFDLDGTLVDSQRDIADAANAVLVECGAAALPDVAIAGMVGEGAATLIARAFAAAQHPRPDDALERFLAAYSTRLLRWTRTYDGITELLATLAPKATLAVLTNKPLDATRSILDGLHLAPYFGDRVLGGDGPLPRKPDAAGLQHLIERCDVTPQRTWMVGDSVVDAKTASNAGARCCVARYGFGFHSFSPELLKSVDRVVDHPMEILVALS